MPQKAASAAAIARSFVTARQSAAPLFDYPGPLPGDLEAAYAIQEAAIGLWPDALAGWKIGLAHGADRIAGPIFARNVTTLKAGAEADLPVFVGGFAAVEAEYVLRIGADQEASARVWRPEDAAEMLGGVHIGIELAGSPFAGINDFGPAITVSDFGNNAGLVVGPALADWRTLDWIDAPARTSIDGELVGEGAAALLPGGPLAALAFILNHCAARGRPLRAGQLISSGAITGVHRIEAGQSAELSFGAAGVLRCRTRPAQAEETPTAAGAGV